MTLTIVIKRRTAPDAKPYFQQFCYEGDGRITVAEWLREVNRTETARERIVWECGCLEKKCGACAMCINGRPALACSVFLRDVAAKYRILLEPLSKFPVIKDLMVDRSVMWDNLKHMRIWMEKAEWTDYCWDRELQYQAGQCLQCGCCLEICPNFVAGGMFAGAAGMIAAYKATEQSEREEHRDEMMREYQKRFFRGCSQSLSCQSVCPMKLPLDVIQARANAHAVWEK